MRESNQEPKDFRRAIEDARTKWEDAVNMDVIVGAGYYEGNFRIGLLRPVWWRTTLLSAKG